MTPIVLVCVCVLEQGVRGWVSRPCFPDTGTVPHGALHGGSAVPPRDPQLQLEAKLWEFK